MGEAKQRKALPSLREWLARMVPSRDADSRDAFAEYGDWVARMLDYAKPDDPEQARCLRMVQAASLAIIESCDREAASGVENGVIAADMCKCLGLAFGYALMSLEWRDDAPLRTFARPFAEEFRTGVKFAIDECLTALPSPALSKESSRHG